MATSIGSTYVKAISMSNISAMNIWIRCVSIRGNYTSSISAKSAFVWGIKWRVLAGLKVILVSLR